MSLSSPDPTRWRTLGRPSVAEPALKGRWPSLLVHVVSLTVAVTGLGTILSAGVDVVMGGDAAGALLLTGLVTAIVGTGLWYVTRTPARIRIVDVFAVVTMSWLALMVVGAVPYVATGTISRFDNAMFEAISGFTTTGATVMRPIEGHSPGVMFWRALSQWIGGMGVIVLVVAVLPTVGSGGMDLLAAEAPGPTGERLTPKVRHTARRLWIVYIGITVVVGVGYLLAGMSLFDAIAHSLTTASTGGFSTYNRSLAHFESAAVEWVAIVGMFAAGGSFTLYYRALTGKIGPLLRSMEFRAYVALVLGATATVHLINAAQLGDPGPIRGSLFTVVSITSTTGFGTADFDLWADGAQVILLLLMPLGAMAGSTAGGVKLVRILAVGSFAARETRRQLHPRLVRPVRIGDAVLDESVSNRVLGFLVLALAFFGAGIVAIAITGVDLRTALSAAATSFGNVGPGLGEVGPTDDFLNLSATARAVCMVEMLLGRLEIYPVLLAVAALPRIRRYR